MLIMHSISIAQDVVLWSTCKYFAKLNIVKNIAIYKKGQRFSLSYQLFCLYDRFKRKPRIKVHSQVFLRYFNNWQFEKLHELVSYYQQINEISRLMSTCKVIFMRVIAMLWKNVRSWENCLKQYSSFMTKLSMNSMYWRSTSVWI